MPKDLPSRRSKNPMRTTREPEVLTPHIYQPLMLMDLLCRRSPAPAKDVARRILGKDVFQIDYYTERVKRIVGRVLTGNGITAVPPAP